MDKHSDSQSHKNKVPTNGRVNGRPQIVKHQPPPPPPPSFVVANQQKLQGKSIEQHPEDGSMNGGQQIEQEANQNQGERPLPRRSLTLRHQLLLTILPVVLVPLAIAGVVSWGLAKYQAANSANSKLGNDAMLSADLASNALDDALKIPSSLAENPLIINAARASNKPVTPAIVPFTTVAPLGSAQVLPQKPSQLSPTLNSYLQQQAKKQNLSQLVVTDKNGVTIGAAATVENDPKMGDPGWKKAKTEGKWISEPVRDRANNLNVELNKAIIDPNSGNEFIGVVKAVMPTENFNELGVPLQHLGLTPSEKIQIIAPASKAVISTVTPDGTKDKQDLVGGEPILQKASDLLGEALSSNIDKSSNGKKPSYVSTKGRLQGLTIIPYVQERQLILSTSFDRDGRKYTLATVPGSNWVSVSSLDLSELGAIGNEQGLIFLLIFLALGAVGAGIVIALARRWSGPLKELSGKSVEAAAGNWDTDTYIEPRGTTETQNLARGFNKMVARVKDLLHNQELEASRAELFADIASSASESPNVNEIFQKAVQGIQQLLDCERVSVYRFNPDWSGDIIAEAAADGVPPCLSMKVADTYFTDSDVGVEQYRTGRVFVIDDIYTANLTPCHREVYERLRIRSVVITPIVGGDKLLGLMCAQQYSSPREWQQSEINFCTQFSTQLGLALDRISYFEQKEIEVKQQEVEAKQAQLFAEIASLARHASDVEILFQKAVQGINRLLNCERVSVFRFNPDWSGDIVAEAAVDGVPPCLNMKVADTYFTDSDVGVELYRNGRVFVIDDIYNVKLTPCHREVYERLKMRSVVITPIVGGDKLLGLLCTQQYSAPRVWQQSEINFCTQLSTQLGLALDRISYFEQKEIEAKKQESEAKQAQLFAEIASNARTKADIEPLFQKAVQETQQLLKSERVSIYSFNPDWSGDIVAEAAADGVPPCLSMKVADTYFTDSDVGVELYRNGRIFVINDIYKANLTPCHREVYERLKMRSVVITPIVGGDKLLGLMCTQQYSAPRVWQQSEINFCTQLGTQLGLVLDRISYFEQKDTEAKKQEAEAKQAQLFAEIASNARATADIEALFQKAVQETQQLLNCERVSIYSFNPDWSGDIVAEAAADGIPPCLSMKVADTYFTDSDVGVELYRNGRVFVINDIYKANLTPCHREVYERLKIRSVVITPIVGGDKLLGLMCTQQYSAPRTWQQSEVNFCTQLSTQVGLALDRISYFEQKESEAKKQETEAKQSQLFAEIASGARQASDVDVIFQKTVQGTQQLLHCERVSVYRFNSDWSGEIVAEATADGVPPCLNMTVADTYFTDSDVGVELYRNGRVFVIDDIYKIKLTPCHREVYERLKIRSVVITPIVGGDKLLGLLCTQQYSAPRVWQQSEVNFCTQLSTQLGLALDRISYFEQKETEAKKQESEAKQSQLFAEIASSARQATDIELLFQKAVQGTQQLLTAERVSVYRFNPDWSGEIVADAAASGIPPCLNMTVADTYFTDSDVGIELYRNGRVLVINDIYKANLTPCHREVYERLKIRSIVITPIVGGDKLLGLFCTQQYSAPRAWQQSEVNFCTQLGTQLGLVLDRINFLEQKESEAKKQESEAKQAQLFADIANNARESLDINEVFNKAVQVALQLANVERVSVYRFNPDWSGQIIVEAAASGVPSCMNMTVADTYFTDSDVGVEAYRNGRIFVIDDIYKAKLTPCHREVYERLKIRSLVITPIVGGDKLLGLLCTQQYSAPRTWQQSEINFCTQLSTQLGLALDRINLLEQKEGEAKRSQLLSTITLRIRESLKLEDILNQAVAEVRRAFETDRVVVYRFDTDWHGKVIAESVAPGWMLTLGVEIADTCLIDNQGGSYNKGHVRAIEDIHKAGLNNCHMKMLERFQVKANLVAPIMLGNQLFGLMIAHHCSTTRVWLKAEIDLFTQLATQVGIALNQATLVEQIQTLLAAQEEATHQQSDNAEKQRLAKEALQRRALELLMEVDPIGKGDLTVRAQVTEDEIGTIADSYNATIGSLRKIVVQVQNAAKQLTTTTSSNEVSVQELSAEALRQTEEIVAALDRIQEMSISIRAVANNAELAEAAVQQATQIVKEGDDAMNRTVDGILAIRETVAETSKKVKRLGESSQKISKVVNLIGTFAAQTNLLALNASIEAARAGEEGRGFAVVADEVRSLARQSAAATAEIEKLVAGIQSETNEVVAAMESGTVQVVTGTRLVDEARQSLNKITAASAQISALVEAIAQAAVVQSKASDEVTQTMSNVAEIANKTSTGATKVQDSFKELLALAQELQANVGKFKVS